MLNTQLQQSINEELENADPKIREFVNSSYWLDTITLISRVNNIKKPEIIEGIELEIILILLNISDYDNIYDALREEVFVDGADTTQESLRQLSADIQEYIFNKLYNKK